MKISWIQHQTWHGAISLCLSIKYKETKPFLVLFSIYQWSHFSSRPEIYKYMPDERERERKKKRERERQAGRGSERRTEEQTEERQRHINTHHPNTVTHPTETHRQTHTPSPPPTTLMHLQWLLAHTQIRYSQYTLLWSVGWHLCVLHRAAHREWLGEQTVVLTSHWVGPHARHAPLTHRIPAGPPKQWQRWEVLIFPPCFFCYSCVCLTSLLWTCHKRSMVKAKFLTFKG